MLRQVGLAVGVAMLVAVLGGPHGPAAELTAFRHGWYATAAKGIAAALSAAVLRRRLAVLRTPVAAEPPGPVAAPGTVDVVAPD